MDPTINPSPQAARPFNRLAPDSTPTMESPSKASMNSSAEPNVSMSGRAICTNNVSITAPTMPPISDAVNAADSARAACPCCERGNPSSTVAWLALEPGIPMSTEVNVSDVGITATRPTNMASADTVSIPYRKGIMMASPAMPPSPGKAPIARPSITPSARCRR